MSQPKPVIRCSGLSRLLSCPGSRTLERKLNEETMEFEVGGDEMTWRGNWIHSQCARRLVNDFGALAPDGFDEPILGRGWKPAEWDFRAVEWFISNVTADIPEDHAIFVERRFTVEFERFILTGQIDVYSLDAGVIEFAIDDNKSGPGEVDHAEENWQLAGYASLLKFAYPTLKRGKIRIRQREADDQTTEAEVDDLDTLVSFLEQKINEALDAWLTLETGYSQCRLCPCVGIPCPAFEAEVIEMKKILSETDLKALNVTPGLRQLGDFAQRCRAIAGPIEKVLEQFKARVATEGDIVLTDGTLVRVVEEDGRRKVTHPKVAHAFISKKIMELTGCTEEDADDLAWKTLAMSVSDAEDVLVEEGEMQRKSTKEEVETAQSWIRRSLGHLIIRPKVKKLLFK